MTQFAIDGAYLDRAPEIFSTVLEGVGAMVIRGLIGLCQGGGIAPIAGCFAKNARSRGALAGAGMFSRARLLKVAV